MTGADRLDLLNRLSTNQLNNLTAGQGRQTILTNEKGRIIDVLTVLVVDTELLVLTASGKEKEVMSWLRKYVVMDDVKIADLTHEFSFVELLGPAATSAVHHLTGATILDLPLSHWRAFVIADIPITLFRAPAVAECSYVAIVPSNAVQTFLDILTDTGLSELDTETFEILRVEAGLPASGKELNTDYNALEAGLIHIVDFKKGCYIGQEVIARLDSYNKVQKRVMGFTSDAPFIPGNNISFDGKDIGVITSSVLSPDFGNIALGYIRGEYATPGATVKVSGEIDAVINNLPFV